MWRERLRVKKTISIVHDVFYKKGSLVQQINERHFQILTSKKIIYLFLFLLLYFYFYPPDLQQIIRGAANRATVELLH